MPPAFTLERVPVGETVINCTHGGHGAPVLLLHGYPQTLALWAKIAPVLAEHYSVVCADLRGYGDSSKPPCLADRSNYAFRTMACDQVGLMQSLGFEQFHVVGHDRGGRTAHRMALDWPERVLSLAVLDIAPTYAMYMETNRQLAAAYWHWYFLALPEPFPERLIGADPDYFFEAALTRFGGARVEDFDPAQLAEYRRCWRDPGMIHGSCSDYRAAASIDLDHDGADQERKVACPTLALWGANGLMARLFDMAAMWRDRCTELHTASLPGGHFFIDQYPMETAQVLLGFIETVAQG